MHAIVKREYHMARVRYMIAPRRSLVTQPSTCTWKILSSYAQTNLHRYKQSDENFIESSIFHNGNETIEPSQ